MAWTEGFAGRLKGYRMATWEELPDLGLYMDQLITYLERLFRPLYGEEKRIITPAMINNYVKSGLVARPVAKKYDRPQIAQLIMLCALKQALSLEDLRSLTDAPQAEDAIAALYGEFCTQLDMAQSVFAGKLDDLTPMRCAVLGAAYSLICQEILTAERLAESK